ncbi:MAG: hypothetical protein GX361_07480 [Bacteroidales bacterium]|nr:hypothetical protein [Bacteroidales bacterium]
MKKIVISFLGALLLIGCNNTPQGMAERSVKKHLKKSVQAYEPISFGSVESVDFTKDSVYILAKDSLDKSLAELKKTSDQFKLASHQKAAKRNKTLIENLEAFYSNKKYKIQHKYKANTSEGKNEEVNKDFYLTGEFVVVE